jgi:hypothetical protein
MRKINLIIYSVFVLIAIYSCEKENNADVIFPEINHKLQAEYNSDGENEINIKFEASNSLNINNPKLTIAVYGYDVFLADATATLITRQNFQISSIPSSLTIKFPKDSYKLIVPETTKENSRYYLHIDWDSDNNGQICTGDITFDHDKKSPYVDLESTITQSYFMKLIPSTTPCN